MEPVRTGQLGGRCVFRRPQRSTACPLFWPPSHVFPTQSWLAADLRLPVSLVLALGSRGETGCRFAAGDRLDGLLHRFVLRLAAAVSAGTISDARPRHRTRIRL